MPKAYYKIKKLIIRFVLRLLGKDLTFFTLEKGDELWFYNRCETKKFIVVSYYFSQIQKRIFIDLIDSKNAKISSSCFYKGEYNKTHAGSYATSHEHLNKVKSKKNFVYNKNILMV